MKTSLKVAFVVIVVLVVLFGSRLLPEKRTIVLEPNPVLAASLTPPPGVRGQGAVYPPRFDVRVGGGTFSAQDVCVDMFSADFWEMGNEAGPLSDYLAIHTEVFINGAKIARNSIDMRFVNLRFFVNDGKQLVGSHGGPLDYCLDTRGYAIGAYTAEIRITSMSGRVYSYTWGFQLT